MYNYRVTRPGSRPWTWWHSSGLSAPLQLSHRACTPQESCQTKNACSPLNKGTWLSNISISWNGWSCGGGHSLARWNVLQKWKQHRPARESHQGGSREPGLDYRSFSKHTLPHTVYRHQLRFGGFRGKLELYNFFFLTCKLKARPNIWRVLSTPQGSSGLLEYFICNMSFFKQGNCTIGQRERRTTVYIIHQLYSTSYCI